jgi:hypothetical protein
MSIRPICDFCHKELEDFGGLVFSPPEKGHGGGESAEQNVQKLHVCRTCYEGMRSMFMKPTKADGDAYISPLNQHGTKSPEEIVQSIKPGIYKHSKKGGLYRVLGIAKHSETLEDLVVYEALYDNEVSKIWARPASMFVEQVLVDGNYVPRFTFVSDTV